MDCEKKITLRGFVYIDENGDSKWQPGEKGIENTSVELIRDNEILLTYLTEDTGMYVFEVCPSEYKVVAQYKQGSDSYIKPTELIVSKSADDYNFIVMKDNSFNPIDYIWIATGFLGFALLFLFFRMSRTNSI